MNVKLKRSVFLFATLLLLILAMGCSIEADYDYAEPQLVTEDEAGAIESKAFVPNLREDAQRVMTFSKYVTDVATADIYYYALVTPPTSRSYINQYQILVPSGKMLTKYVSLDSIDYVNSTWGVIGSSNANRKIQLKVMNASPIVLNFPSDTATIKDIAGKARSNSQIEIYITVPAQYYGSYIRKGLYTIGSSSISWSSTYTSRRFHGIYDTALSIDGNYFYKLFNYMPSYFLRQFSFGGTVYKENLSPYTAHGYRVNGALLRFDPFEFDFSTYGAGFIFGLVRNGETNDLVRMLKSRLEF